MTLKQLQYFVTTVQTQSFKETAARLYVSPPAITQQIQGLEQELGCPLFIRSAHSIQLTEAGKSFYDDVAPILEQLETAVVRARHFNGLPSARLIFGYISTPVDFFIQNGTRMLHKDYPDIRIEFFPCEFNEVPYLLSSHAIDVSFITRNYILEPDNLVFIPVATYAYSLVLPSTHKLAQKNSLALKDLHSIPFICLNPKHNTPLFNDYIEKNMSGYTKRYVDSLTELYTVMRNADGFSILPDYLCQYRPDSKSFPLTPRLEDSLGIVYQKDCSNPNIQLACKYLLSTASTNELSNLSFNSFLS